MYIYILYYIDLYCIIAHIYIIIYNIVILMWRPEVSSCINEASMSSNQRFFQHTALRLHLHPWHPHLHHEGIAEEQLQSYSRHHSRRISPAGIAALKGEDMWRWSFPCMTIPAEISKIIKSDSKVGINMSNVYTGSRTTCLQMRDAISPSEPAIRAFQTQLGNSCIPHDYSI